MSALSVLTELLVQLKSALKDLAAAVAHVVILHQLLERVVSRLGILTTPVLLTDLAKKNHSIAIVVGNKIFGPLNGGPNR